MYCYSVFCDDFSHCIRVFVFDTQGPILRGWFLSLDRMIGPTKLLSDAVKKVLAD